MLISLIVNDILILEEEIKKIDIREIKNTSEVSLIKNFRGNLLNNL